MSEEEKGMSDRESRKCAKERDSLTLNSKSITNNAQNKVITIMFNANNCRNRKPLITSESLKITLEGETRWVNDFVGQRDSSEEIRLFLALEGPLTPTQIIEKTSIPERTVRYALNKLKEKNQIKTYKTLNDMRITKYAITEG